MGIQSVSDGNGYVVVLDWIRNREEDKEKEGEERNALEATTVETKPDTRLPGRGQMGRNRSRTNGQGKYR